MTWQNILRRVQCFFVHDYGQWGEDLPEPYMNSRYFQYRGCRRCRRVKERMLW